MNTLQNSTVTVGKLVAARPERARVFERYQIDYCCDGKTSLEDACARKNLDFETIVRELEASDADSGASDTNWTAVPLSELIVEIIRTHHDYLRDELPRISALSNKVARVHGEKLPALVELEQVFAAFRDELEDHMMKEEMILFPWIRALEQGTCDMGGTVAMPIRCMEQEHDNAGAALERMRNLTNDYTPPADACNSWRVLYDALARLERDMHTHVHKENHILFPRALEFEA